MLSSRAGGDGSGLRIEGLVVRFGGLTAVGGVSLEAPRGRLTGLIGPNGAGKTTTFNAATGLQRPTTGTVELFGRDITGLPPHIRAQRGLGRTFQRMELFDCLPVRQNVEMGAEAALAGSNPMRHVWGRRGEARSVAASAQRALETCDILHLAGMRPADLSTGQRRLVELARVMAGGFSIILLDEPSSGLDRAETARFGLILRDLVARGHGILLVEHDMALVLEHCDYVYVLDFGQLLFEGTPAEVTASEAVRSAYLGSDAGISEEAVG